jgi:hypothetical protein
LLDEVPVSACPEALEARRQEGLQAKQALNAVARTPGQEISLRVTDEGWVIEVFSCYRLDDRGIKVFIPKNQSRAIEVRASDEAVAVFNK